MSRVRTVLGDVQPSELGLILPHEHIHLKATNWWLEPSKPWHQDLVDAPITLFNIDAMKRNPHFSKKSMLLNEVELMTQELVWFKEAGGGAVVDVTTDGIGRNPAVLRRISNDTGLHVVASCGYYVQPTFPDWIAKATVEEIAGTMLGDIEEGIDGSKAKAGLIGELGVSPGRLAPDEEKVLRAAASVQQKTGLAIVVHTWEPWLPKNSLTPVKVLDLLESVGADLAKVCMAHAEWTFHQMRDWSYLLKMADRGIFVAFDSFGQQFPFAFDSYHIIAPTDYERAKGIDELIKHGFASKILASTDICHRVSLRTYGGYGYTHLIYNVRPLLEYLGVSDRDIRRIMVENPQRMLSF